MKATEASHPQEWQTDQEHGFSMVELMVVIFIIGLVATFIVLSASPQRSELLSDADEFASLLERAADEAIVSGNAHGAILQDRSVQIVRWEEGSWRPLTGAYQGLSRDIAIRDFETGDVASENGPQITFNATGVNRPASFRLTDGREHVVLNIEASGVVSTLAEAADAR